MKKIIIDGREKLSGTIPISGAKNSAVALIPATILSSGKIKMYNTPDILDTESLIEIMTRLGSKIKFKDNVLEIDNRAIQYHSITKKLAKKLRASYYFMGAMLGRYKKVEIYYPGGCNIGVRPIDIHLKGFKKLGAKVKYNKDKYIITAQKLKGTKIYLDFASVGATINIMLAAVYAEGKTTISNAAKEPEIVNVACLLNDMGAEISGAGTSEIVINGVKKMGDGIVEIVPDRIEAGTYTIIGALLGKDLIIDNVIPDHIKVLLAKLKETGANIKVEESRLIINKVKKLSPINIKTLVYPGFPTDLGQPMCSYLTQCEGTSLFEETIYENRMGHVSFLNDMGANINGDMRRIKINGKTNLTGSKVVCTDLRAGAALVIAGLIAKGKTTIFDVEHILRGYENIVGKLSAVNAKISLEETDD